MTLNEAFALVRENGLTWHGLHEERGEWYVRLKTMRTYSGMPSYGFGQHVDLTESIRQAILAAKEWETWRPSETLPPPAFGRKAKSVEAQAALALGVTQEQIDEAIAAIKGGRK